MDFVLSEKPSEHAGQTGDVICFIISKDHSGCYADDTRQSGVGHGDQLAGCFHRRGRLMVAWAGIWQWRR